MTEIDGGRLLPLRHFLAGMARLVETAGDDENRMLDEGERLLTALIATDDWLAPYCAEPDPRHYTQYLLYCDPLERFSVVSFVWGPGQKTPIHDHTAWGLVGMLRGAETECRYRKTGSTLVPGDESRLVPGMVARLSPRDGDIHRVANAFDDRVSISIHVYGANIGKVSRNVFDPATGAAKSFVSGYTNAVLPNAWM